MFVLQSVLGCFFGQLLVDNECWKSWLRFKILKNLNKNDYLDVFLLNLLLILFVLFQWSWAPPPNIESSFLKAHWSLLRRGFILVNTSLLDSWERFPPTGNFRVSVDNTKMPYNLEMKDPYYLKEIDPNRSSISTFKIKLIRVFVYHESN